MTILRREEVRGWDWPDLVREVRRQAWRRGCAIVIFDTVRAWCPEAEQSNAQAAEVMNLARAELAGRGLAVVFVHHDTKAGGEYGEQVAGPNNLVGSCDVLVALQRVKGQDTARRMLVSRRFGDQDLTARLEGHRYVAPALARAAVPAAVRRGELAPARARACAAGCGARAVELPPPGLRLGARDGRHPALHGVPPAGDGGRRLGRPAARRWRRSAPPAGP